MHSHEEEIMCERPLKKKEKKYYQADSKVKKKTTISSYSSLWNSLDAGDFHMVL